MDVTKTIKVKLLLTIEEKVLLLQTMLAYAKACDFVSQYVFTTKDLKQASIHRHVYTDLRDTYGMPSQMACNCIRTVIASYKTLLANNQEWTECKYTKPQLTLSRDRDYSFLKDKLSIGTLQGRIHVLYIQKGFEKYFDASVYSFGAAKVVCQREKWFLCIPVTFTVNELQNMDVTNVVGHDRGLRFFVTSYDSSGNTYFYSGKQAARKRAHYKQLRREFQQRKTPSARRRLKVIGQRENRWMQDVNHCISKALVANAPKGTLHVLEDLSGIRAVTEKVKTKRRYLMVSWSYYDFEQKLMYKALEHGQKVIKVSAKYTSQTCPKCGHVAKNNRNKRKHLFCCENCGYQSNDDRIGAMNLYRKGIEYLVESQVSSAYL